MHDSGVHLSGDGPGIDMGYELVGRNTYSLPMFLTPPSTSANVTAWTIPGRLRFRVVRLNQSLLSYSALKFVESIGWSLLSRR